MARTRSIGSKSDGTHVLAAAANEKEVEGSTTGADSPGEVADADEQPVEYITGFKLLAVMSSVTLTAFLMMLDISIISTAVPRITSDFHSLPDVGWYTAAYQLASASLQPLTGKLYTHFRVKWTYLVFLFMFEAGSLICGLAKSSSMLIGGRAIAGIGGSGLMNGAMTIIAGALPLHQRALAQLGIVCGPLVGGALTEYATWRWCFYINLPVGGLVAFLMTFTSFPELTKKPPFTLAHVRSTIPELDLAGFALFAPAAVMFLLALQFGGNTYAWSSSVVIGLFCGAGALAVVFVLWERRRGDRAMLPGPIIRQRIVLSSAVNGMALMATIFVASQFMPIYFQGVRGETPTMSGVDLLPSILSQLLTVVVSGAIVSKVGYYLPFAVASGAVSAIGNGLLSTYSPTTETPKWIGYQILTGAGRGLGMQLGLIAVQNALLPQQIPVGIAFMIFCQNFSGAVFVVVGTVIFTQSLTSELAVHAPSVPPEAAHAAGASASAVRALVPPGSSELDGVLLAFSNSVDKVFYLLIATSLVGFVSAWGMGWVDTRKKKAPEKGEP
ncbi:hypothetical protein JX266_002554 [Neoarthrinium moseri]|nr:hypothetical protein JX266_002554 [Neoarthrinium moseri]